MPANVLAPIADDAGARIRVAIVEDNTSLRESLQVLLSGTPGFCTLAGFGNAEEALKQLPALQPDVVLMDIHLPRMDGVECVRRLKALLPQTRVLMLTIFADPDHIFRALLAGASGYVSKRTPPAELMRYIAEAFRGGAPISNEIAVRMVEHFNQKGAAQPPAELSPREREILELLAQGFLYKEIAAQLGIAYDTVHFHTRRLYEKLQVHSRAQAVAKYRDGSW